MTFSFAVFGVVLVSVVCLTPIRAQVVDDEVVCTVAVTWYDGELRLHDLVSGTGSIVATVDDNLNSLTRDESSGIFYFASGNTLNIWKYDPCNGDIVTKIGSISGMTSTSFGLAYCIDDNGLYMTSGSNLYSIDLDSLDATLIGYVGTAVQGLECDNNGDLYGSQFSRGLVKINKNNANVTVINSNVPNLLYLTYDPNNDNVLYGSDSYGNIVEVNKTSGAYNVTNLSSDATDYRGMIILDQDSCNGVTDCPMIPTYHPTPLPTDDGLCPNLNDAIDDCSEDPNCVDCSSWGGCNECADGYWLFQYNFACQACSKIDNCDTCNSWIGCSTCDPHYTITWVEQCPLAQGGVSTIATCV